MLPTVPGQIATVLVALAVTESRPSQMRVGNERRVPPPATELIAPARKADPKAAPAVRGVKWGTELPEYKMGSAAGPGRPQNRWPALRLHVRDAAVPAGVVQDRVGLGDAGGDHAADEDVVIAGGETLVSGALDVGDCAGEQRNAGLAGLPREGVEAVLALAREAVGQVSLVGGEDVDAERG